MGFARAAAFVGLLGFGVGTVLCAACAPFSSNSSNVQAADDAEAAVPDALDLDARDRDAGRFCATQDAAVLCDDFEGLGFASWWEPTSPSLQIERNSGILPGGVLLIRAPVLASSSADLSYSLSKEVSVQPAAFDVTIDLDVRVELGGGVGAGNGPEIVTFSLTAANGKPTEVNLTLEEGHVFLSEYDEANSYHDYRAGSPTFRLANLMHVTVVLHAPARGSTTRLSAELAVNGGLTKRETLLSVRGDATTLQVRVGLPSLTHPAAALEYRIDNVVLRVP